MKRAAYALGAVVLLAVLLVLLAPLAIDRPAVRAEIQRRVGQALEGQVSWEALEIGLFPAPHGVLRRVRVEMPGRASAAADTVRVYLRLWPLLRGRAEIASVAVSRPEVRISARQEQAKSETEPFDAVSAYREALEPVVKALQQFAPDTVVRIEQAAVDPGELRELECEPANRRRRHDARARDGEPLLEAAAGRSARRLCRPFGEWPGGARRAGSGQRSASGDGSGAAVARTRGAQSNATSTRASVPSRKRRARYFCPRASRRTWRHRWTQSTSRRRSRSCGAKCRGSTPSNRPKAACRQRLI